MLPLGEWSHPHGKIAITADRARHFVEQFQSNVAGQELPVWFVHNTDANRSNPLYGVAAGWITSMQAHEQDGVVIDIEFTEKAAEQVNGGEYRYLSAEYFDKVQLPHHDAPETDVIVGVSLMNRPHLKGMRPILNEETGHQFLVEQGGDDNPNPGSEGGGPMDPILVALAESAGVDLSDDQTELTDEQREAIAEHQAEAKTALTDAEASVTTLEEKLAKSDPKGAKMRSLAEAGFEDEAKEIALARGDRLVRNLEGQVDGEFQLAPVVVDEMRAYAEDSDVDHLITIAGKFASGKALVDLEEHGSSEGGGGADNDSDADKGAGDKLVALAEKMAKEDEISFTEALDKVLEDPENRKAYNAYRLSMDSEAVMVEA